MTKKESMKNAAMKAAENIDKEFLRHARLMRKLILEWINIRERLKSAPKAKKGKT